MRSSSLLDLLNDLLGILLGRQHADEASAEPLRPERPTVVLISGFVATHRALSVMRKRLLRDGYNVVVWSLDWHTLADGVRGFYRMAEKLSSVILELRKGRGLGLGQGYGHATGKARAPIYLVAHSAGGLVARYYIQLLGGSYYCDALITLATPHRGLWKATLGLATHLVLRARCLLQMTPPSPFLKTLNHAAYPQGFRMISIHSTDDYLCGQRSAQLPESLLGRPEVESVEIARLSHGGFLLSKRGYELLRHYLETPARPATAPPASSGPATQADSLS